MRKIILLMLFVTSCGSLPEFRKDVQVGYYGCSDKKRAERIQCISDMLEDLELITDPKNKPQSKIIENRRYDSMYVRVTKRTCFSPHFCVDEIEYQYSPTFWGAVKAYGFVGIVGYLAGLVTAVSLNLIW